MKYHEVFVENTRKRVQIVQKWIFVETLHATSSFSSSAMCNKERRNVLRLYKDKKTRKIVKYREVFDEKMQKRVQLVQKKVKLDA